MPIKPNEVASKAEESPTPIAPPPSKRAIYPPMNPRFGGMLLWLGLAFVVMVFLVQHISGYA